MKKTKILIAVDEEEFAENILKTVCRFIDRSRAVITLLNVMETTPAEEAFFLRNPEAFINYESKKSNLANLDEFLEKEGFEYSGIVFRQGNAGKEILKYARENDFDLIVIGSHNKNSFERIMLGSTSYKVIRNSKCSVLVVKPSLQKIKVSSEFNVLFTTDGSVYSDFAAEKLAELIDFNRAKVSVVNVRVPIEVILPQDAFSYADLNKITEESEIVEKEIVKDTALILAKHRFEFTKKYRLSGDPSGKILEECKPSKYDLVVAGAQGKNEIAGFFMGSVSSKIYDRSKIPVLIVKKR